MNQTTLRLALIGDPVAHSQSPALQQALLEQYGRTGRYAALRVPLEETAATLHRLHAEGYHGLNVTTPLKEAVIAELSSADPLVAQIHAANTLISTPAGWHGANTDGNGACAALTAAFAEFSAPPAPSHDPLRGRSILVLGVGPTARAAIASFKGAQADVYIWNRTVARAHEIADNLHVKVWTPAATIEAVFATLPPDPDIPPEMQSVLTSAPICIDANYGPRATLHNLIKRPVLDGRSMLAAQAEASLKMWLAAYP